MFFSVISHSLEPLLIHAHKKHSLIDVREKNKFHDTETLKMNESVLLHLIKVRRWNEKKKFKFQMDIRDKEILSTGAQTLTITRFNRMTNRERKKPHSIYHVWIRSLVQNNFRCFFSEYKIPLQSLVACEKLWNDSTCCRTNTHANTKQYNTSQFEREKICETKKCILYSGWIASIFQYFFFTLNFCPFFYLSQIDR